MGLNAALVILFWFLWHFLRIPFSKNQFRNIPTRNRATRASGFGVPLPPPRPPNSRKKKKIPKKVPNPPPSPPPIDWKLRGAIRKNFPDWLAETERVPAGHGTSRWPWAFSRAKGAPFLQPDPHRAPKGQPIRTDLTAPLHYLTNYLYTYLIRLLPHSFAPLPSLSLSLIRLVCPGVNMNSHPNPLLKVRLG